MNLEGSASQFDFQRVFIKFIYSNNKPTCKTGFNFITF